MTPQRSHPHVPYLRLRTYSPHLNYTHSPNRPTDPDVVYTMDLSAQHGDTSPHSTPSQSAWAGADKCNLTGARNQFMGARTHARTETYVSARMCRSLVPIGWIRNAHSPWHDDDGVDHDATRCVKGMSVQRAWTRARNNTFYPTHNAPSDWRRPLALSISCSA